MEIFVVGVSIPSWVFWSSRLEDFGGEVGFGVSFNPVLGFLVVSTNVRDRWEQEFDRFQSRLGFSGRLDTLCRTAWFSIPSCFNPVLGFLVVSTSWRGCPYHCLVRVSIPSWVFWSSRHLAQIITDGGFCKFQSRLGFSGRLDRRGNFRHRLDTNVSIPSWVFWSSRRTCYHTEPACHIVSIPSWVFWSSRLSRVVAGKIADVSIPSWVFWSSRQVSKRTLRQAACQFQSRLGFSGRLDDRPLCIPC